MLQVVSRKTRALNYRKKRHRCIIAYIAGKGRSGGPKRRLNDADDSLIEAIIKEDDSLEIARLFGLRRCGDENFAGTTLVRRARLRREIVTLVYDRTHIAASKASQELHYRICASVHEDRFINFDEVTTALQPMFAPFPAYHRQSSLCRNAPSDVRRQGQDLQEKGQGQEGQAPLQARLDDCRASLQHLGGLHHAGLSLLAHRRGLRDPQIIEEVFRELI